MVGDGVRVEGRETEMEMEHPKVLRKGSMIDDELCLMIMVLWRRDVACFCEDYHGRSDAS